MTAQPYNRFVFCVVVLAFAVNGNQALKKMGFGYEKRERQRIFSERPEIIAWRERYLRRIRK